MDDGQLPYEYSASHAGLCSLSTPKFGKVIPNRIFVGGIDFKVTEEDLTRFFSTFGRVQSAKVIRDRAEISKGFGFVTFVNVEDAEKVKEQNSLHLNGKLLNIGPAVEKLQTNLPNGIHIPIASGSWISHPKGYSSLTHPNGITYFRSTQSASMQQQVLGTFWPFPPQTVQRSDVGPVRMDSTQQQLPPQGWAAPINVPGPSQAVPSMQNLQMLPQGVVPQQLVKPLLYPVESVPVYVSRPQNYSLPAPLLQPFAQYPAGVSSQNPPFSYGAQQYARNQVYSTVGACEPAMTTGETVLGMAPTLLAPLEKSLPTPPLTPVPPNSYPRQ